MRLGEKILSLISSCILFTSAVKTSNAGFLTFLGCAGGFFTVINLSELLGSLFDKDEKTKIRLKETITSVVFSIGMFVLDYSLDKYHEKRDHK